MKTHHLIPIVCSLRECLYRIGFWWENDHHLQGKLANSFKPNYPIVIKRGVSVEIGAYFRSLGLAYLNANDRKLDMGSNFFLNRNIHIDAFGGNIKIGDDVLIGRNSFIRAFSYEFSRVELIRN